MTQTTGRDSTTADRRLDPEVLKVAAALIVGLIAVIFDTTIVAVALQTLSRELHTTVDTIQWVTTAYLLALGASIPLVAWAQARLGGKRLWLIALTVFLAGSVLCTLAWDAPSLIGFRVVQGIGGGLMTPLMQTLVMQAAGGKNLGRVMGIVMLPAVLGPILGPVVGGLVLHWLDWRWLFLVNVPVCAIGFALAVWLLPADRPSGRARLDVTGLLLMCPAMVGLLLGLSDVSKPGGVERPDVWGPVLAGAVLLALFVRHARRTGDRALVRVGLLKRRSVAAAAVLLFLSGAALFGAMLLLPLYWQQVWGQDVLGAGLLLAPQGVGILVSRPLAGRLTDTVGPRRVALVGFVVVGVATAVYAVAGPQTPWWVLLTALVVRGAGFGALMVPITTVAYIGLERDLVPHASILTRICQQVGGSFGTAVLAVVLTAGTASAGHDRARLAAGFDDAFWWAVAFTVLATAVCFLIPGRPSPSRQNPSRQS
ncbi:MDR family MFS transporter [Tersicoccus sp. MR15.9]|uniref:MDR family MFS transporter n=1 Tax=Tersicoccus mangrovi TaxID=3121635 RepID=UPI002FE60A3F